MSAKQEEISNDFIYVWIHSFLLMSLAQILKNKTRSHKVMQKAWSVITDISKTFPKRQQQEISVI